MNLVQTIELNTALVVSIVAVILSAYSIIKSNKRSDATELKEATKQLTEALTELKMIKDTVLGKPTMGEQIAKHETVLGSHERRISILEKSQNCN